MALDAAAQFSNLTGSRAITCEENIFFFSCYEFIVFCLTIHQEPAPNDLHMTLEWPQVTYSDLKHKSFTKYHLWVVYVFLQNLPWGDVICLFIDFWDVEPIEPTNDLQMISKFCIKVYD